MKIFKCIICGKEFKRYGKSITRRPNKFCSLKCRGIAQSEGLTHKHTEHKLKCQYCGKEFLIRNRIKLDPKRYKYCSKKCYSRAQKTGYVLRDKSEYTKRLKEKKDGKCLICKYKRFIEIVHYTPASKGGDYSKKNILFLCPNHHRLFDNDLLNEKEKVKIKNWHAHIR